MFTKDKYYGHLLDTNFHKMVGTYKKESNDSSELHTNQALSPKNIERHLERHTMELGESGDLPIEFDEAKRMSPSLSQVKIKV